MAIQGPSYRKTQWVFEERPVSSAKLNQWDDRIEAALEMAFLLIAEAWGGGDGVLRNLGPGALVVEATAPVGLGVTVSPGYAFIGGYPYRLVESTPTALVEAPAVNGRVDLVQADLATWSVSIKTGVEAASPVAPTVDSGSLALATLVLRPGMVSIKDVDDGVNGYIEDVRVFV